jgi:hypothetical protein
MLYVTVTDNYLTIKTVSITKPTRAKIAAGTKIYTRKLSRSGKLYEFKSFIQYKLMMYIDSGMLSITLFLKYIFYKTLLHKHLNFIQKG